MLSSPTDFSIDNPPMWTHGGAPCMTKKESSCQVGWGPDGEWIVDTMGSPGVSGISGKAVAEMFPTKIHHRDAVEFWAWSSEIVPTGRPR
mmetsp:Transcript_121346/g.210926  ORF Transcript_121346/g.210926 Transcript_121346/m.210926 type:complete len:90 (-) Transcript_121346:70-339(-)